MGRKPVVSIGNIYGKLKVLSRAGATPHGAALWLCLCACGNEKKQRSDQLTTGASISCGCYAKAKFIERVTTHGKTNTFEFRVWTAMRKRCFDPNHVRYHRYGGRGITVCDRWNDFALFLADMGECHIKNGSIERVDNDKGYFPDNCKWLPKKEQSKNRDTKR